ncbi:MAG: GGDEF domain-containing protein [Clostridiales bacterium]|nr:MAG: GGDEF domain-containing protein [Clostridiales bacterium]
MFEMKKYKERLALALKASRICVFEVDIKNQLYTFFENAEDIFGVSGKIVLDEVRPFSELSPDEYQKKVSEYFSHPEDAEVIDKAFKNIFNGTSTTYNARMKAGGSNFIWCKVDVTPIMDNNEPVRMIGVITDISEIKAKTALLEKKSLIDSFTGLYNKNYSIKLIKDIFNKKNKQKHALVFIDIDNFKKINDTLGHFAGDDILKLFSEKIKSVVRKHDIIGRFGGDEFIILIQDIKNKNEIEAVLQRLMQCDNDNYSFTVSIGVSVFSQDGSDFNDLFKKADRALYQSKIYKNIYTFYSDL